jgi:NAD(P)-dependent dehydrogenase (short-subunit alcohol dehydrogenase family)
MKLAGKVAIVTGAAGGIGEATARLFAEEGAAVAVIDLTEAAAQATVDRIAQGGGKALAIAGDVSKARDVRGIVEHTVATLGAPTVLINNAGVDKEGRVDIVDASEEDFDRTMEVNVKGVWLMMKYVIPHMIAGGGGSIVNVASIAAFLAGSSAGYCASKAGVVAMSRVAAVELGKHNIRVNSLCPGAVWTPMAREGRETLKARGEEPGESMIHRMSALGRFARAEELAKAALFLASDDSSFATGAPFIIDGGWTSLAGVRSPA